MLTHLPRHRKNDPLWRKHRIRPTPAFSRFPPIRSLTLEGPIRVEAVEKVVKKMPTISQTKIFRDFSTSDRPLTSKTNQDQQRVKTPWSFYTASVEDGPSVRVQRSSQKGGKRPYRHRLGKDRSGCQSCQFIASGN
jgi:hypothetical protein